MKHPRASDCGGLSADPQALASELAPVVQEACRGSLGSIQWFRSSWQMGGAATGMSTWTFQDGQSMDVLVKLPVGYTEHFWSTRLGSWSPGSNHVCVSTPRIVAAGDKLGNYDLAWLVVERLRGGTLGHDLAKEQVTALLEAVCEFHQRASEVKPVSEANRPDPPDWVKLVERARESVRDNHIDHEQRWAEGLRKVHRGLGDLIDRWRRRPICTWCHGDLHPGNAMHRGPEHGQGEVILIDLALVHAGHWIEDAVYLERQYWGHEHLLHGVKPVSALARLRRRHGLKTGEEYAELANIRRLMMASCAPAFLGREGNPLYLETALRLVETLGHQLLR